MCKCFQAPLFFSSIGRIITSVMTSLEAIHGRFIYSENFEIAQEHQNLWHSSWSVTQCNQLSSFGVRLYCWSQNITFIKQAKSLPFQWCCEHLHIAVKWGLSLHTSQVAYQAREYPSFSNMKRLGIFLLPSRNVRSNHEVPRLPQNIAGPKCLTKGSYSPQWVVFIVGQCQNNEFDLFAATAISHNIDFFYRLLL